MRRSFVALFLIPLVAIATSVPWKAGRSVESWSARSYIQKLPKAVEQDGSRLPLVVLLHGFTGSAEAIEAYSGLGSLAESEGFILVVPQGLGRPTGWNCGFINLGKAGVDDLSFLSKLLDRVTTELPVDPARVFVAGHSNGAMMANALGGLRPDKIAAIAAVAGVIGVGKSNPKMMPNPKGPISVLHIHGTADQVVAYSPGAVAVLTGVGAKDAVKWWAEKDGITASPTETQEKGFESILYQSHTATVQLLSLIGWGHDWPTSQQSPINGARTIWNFFKAHPKRLSSNDPK